MICYFDNVQSAWDDTAALPIKEKTHSLQQMAVIWFRMLKFKLPLQSGQPWLHNWKQTQLQQTQSIPTPQKQKEAHDECWGQSMNGHSKHLIFVSTVQNKWNSFES